MFLVWPKVDITRPESGKADTLVDCGVRNCSSISGAQRVGRNDGIQRGESVGGWEKRMEGCDARRDIFVGELSTLNESIGAFVKRYAKDITRVYPGVMSAFSHNLKRKKKRTY